MRFACLVKLQNASNADRRSIEKNSSVQSSQSLLEVNARRVF